MLKRSSWISVLAAGGLLVAGCSSSSGTAAPAATTAATSTSSSSSSSSSSTSETSSEDDTSTAVSAAELDEATTTWFTTFCTSITDIGQYISPDTAGQSLAEAQSTVVTAYTGISTSAAKAAGDLAVTPPPTIDGGDQVAAGFVTGFESLADVYGRGAQTVAALTPSTEADLKTAIDAVEKEAQSVQPESMQDLDPGVEAAVEQLPECKSLG